MIIHCIEKQNWYFCHDTIRISNLKLFFYFTIVRRLGLRQTPNGYKDGLQNWVEWISQLTYLLVQRLPVVDFETCFKFLCNVHGGNISQEVWAVYLIIMYHPLQKVANETTALIWFGLISRSHAHTESSIHYARSGLALKLFNCMISFSLHQHPPCNPSITLPFASYIKPLCFHVEWWSQPICNKPAASIYPLMLNIWSKRGFS